MYLQVFIYIQSKNYSELLLIAKLAYDNMKKT